MYGPKKSDIGQIPTIFPMDATLPDAGVNSMGKMGNPFMEKSGKSWMDNIRKGAGGFQKGLAQNQSAPAQSSPFQFSPLSEPAPDPNGSPLTQSILAQIIARIGAGNTGGY